MSENLVKLYVEEFTTNLVIALQQKESKLRGRVMEGHHIGQQASPIEYIKNIQMQAPAGRYSPLNRQDVDFVRRWVLPVDKEAMQLIDTFDKLKLLQDPTSRYVEVAAAAVAREWDDRIIGAAFGTALTGTGISASLTSETWASISSTYLVTASFGAAANAGLTAAKIKEAKRIMRKAQVPVDDEALTIVTNSQGESDLLNEIQVVSTDFAAADRPTLVEGKVTRFLGFDIVYSERLQTATTNVRQNMAFVKSGLYLGIWLDMRNDIAQRKDLSSLPFQVYTQMSSGATRLEPGRLIEVDCADTSTAADVTP
jgi:hypothetical protein